jgi:hypothetical protein
MLRLERSQHGGNVENNLQSNGQLVLEFPEVHDWHIEAMTSALDNAVSSPDYCDAATAIDEAFDGHVVLQVRVHFVEKVLCLLKSVEDTAPRDPLTLCDVDRRRQKAEQREEVSGFECFIDAIDCGCISK